MSQRLADELPAGMPCVLAGPSGSCHYGSVAPDRPLVLAGTGTGLAPLWGVLHDALSAGHRGAIRLYHGARDASGLYLVDELRALQAAHPQFRYLPTHDDLIETVRSGEPALADSEFFLCGDAALVNRLKRTLYLAGARLDSLHADPFVPAAVPDA